MTHARDSFQATLALEPWQQLSACGGLRAPCPSPPRLQQQEVLDLTALGALAAKRPP